MRTPHTSLKDTSELRKLILENPDLPLLIFANEDANNGDYSYMQADVTSVSIQKLALYNDEQWLDEDEFEEEIADKMSMDDEYKNLSNEDFDKAVKEKINNTGFVKAIVITVG